MRVCALSTRALGKLGVAGIPLVPFRPLPLSACNFERPVSRLAEEQSHRNRGNGRLCWSICSATHCSTCLLVWRKEKKSSSGGLSKSREPAEASSDADVLATLWHFCLSRIYIYRKWPKPCVFPPCLFMLNSLVSWLILQLTSENVSKCHILATFSAWLHPAQINLNQTFRNKANKFCCCV